MKYAITATAETPLSFRTGRNNSQAATFDYIPGSALLGGLVNAHHTMHPNQSDELDRLFFAESTRLNNLYPAGLPNGMDEALAEKLAPLADPKLPVYPFPRTARSCKRFGGFLFDAPAAGDHHGLHDHLVSLALFEMNQHQPVALLKNKTHCCYPNPADVECQCGEDRSSHLHGYYRRGETADQWCSFEASQMLRTHNGISRNRGAVQESILFSRAVLAAGNSFWGTLWVADDAAEAMSRFIEAASQAGMVRVGSNRSRGLGRVALSLSALEPDTPAALTARLEKFNQKLTQEADQHGIALACPTYAPVTLTSDAILVDHLLRYQLYLNETWLSETHNLAGARLVYSNAAPQRVMGWNSLYRLPKADELAIAKGSVFLFGFESALTADLVDNLFKLQESGVGLRRREGYGQLLVANPFHWEADNV